MAWSSRARIPGPACRGRGRFYDTRGAANRDEYRDASESEDSEVIAARKRFEKYLQKIPLPDEKDPSTRQAWKRFRASPKGAPKISTIWPRC
jgi:hypothetical protein